MRYNCACALALGGREDECALWLARCVADGSVDAHEVVADDDFAPLRAREWMAALVAPAADAAMPLD
eukprot:528512-Prymnesium_polylepis.1